MFKGSMGNMMKKMQEMQANMQKMQEELGKKTVTGQAGGGAVEVVLNGHFACERVNLNDESLTEDKDMLEALIAAAINDATQKAQALSQSEMSNLAGGIDLPAGFKLPF